jgi:pyrroline-5-carboxylate reductase
MGQAMLKGWLAQGISPANILVVEQDPRALDDIPLQQRPALVLRLADVELIHEPVCAVLAVKPQVADSVLADLSGLPLDSVLLSIAAGVTIDRLKQKLSPFIGVVRAMPNLPASIGAGVTVMVADAAVTETQKVACDELLRATGRSIWAENESCLDAVTALSGSGPAYVFLMIEVMTQVGIELGLDAAMAKTLAAGTVHGAASLAEGSTDSATSLREQVTSPGGTTQAALKVLMRDTGMLALFRDALTAARDRSVELRTAEPALYRGMALHPERMGEEKIRVGG